MIVIYDRPADDCDNTLKLLEDKYPNLYHTFIPDSARYILSLIHIYDIFCFNVESVPELEIINELAAAKGKTARVAFRINPNVGCLLYTSRCV